MKSEIKTITETWEVENFLRQLELDRTNLLEVAAMAIGAASDVTNHDPANAVGTLSYIYGTRALRDKFIGCDTMWECDRAHGVESIINKNTNMKVVFQNVNIACSKKILPKPRTKKGIGSERVCRGNLFEILPHFSSLKISEQDGKTYFLMVSEDGAVELSRPIVRGGDFCEYIDRIFIGNIRELDEFSSSISDEMDEDIDITITSKG